jgi:hypothetical protein
MSVLSLLLNRVWIVCGGLWMAVGWIVATIIMVITIVGVPWAKAVALSCATSMAVRRPTSMLLGSPGNVSASDGSPREWMFDGGAPRFYATARNSAAVSGRRGNA